jgi:hypothetical protein
LHALLIDERPLSADGPHERRGRERRRLERLLHEGRR